MKPAPTLSPWLRGLLILCDEVALAHRIPTEAVLFCTLANAAALAGDLITSKPLGTFSLPARFSVLVTTRDVDCPAWIGDEISHLLNRQEETLRAANRLGPVAALRRHRRALHAVGAEEEDYGLGGVDLQISLAKRRHGFRFIHRVGSHGKPPGLATGFQGIALVATGCAALQRVLNPRFADRRAGQSAPETAKRSCVQGWVSFADWGRLTKGTPRSCFPTFGWIVQCGGSSYRPELDVAPRLLSPLVLSRLEIARLGAVRFAFQPSDEAKALLARQGEQEQEMLATVPAILRDAVVPNQFLAWHLAALLVAICGHGTGEHFVRSEIQCTQLATVIASWVVAGHVYDFRQAFPADEDGPISGQELSVFRCLSDVPAPVRGFQRRLRGEDKESCLRSLHKLIQAGLAAESEPGRFTAVLRPGPSRGVSDFLSEFDPKQVFPLRGSPNFTDSTDNPTFSLSDRTPVGGNAPATTPNQTNHQL